MNKKLLCMTGLVALLLTGCGPSVVPSSTSSVPEPGSTPSTSTVPEPAKAVLEERLAALGSHFTATTPFVMENKNYEWTLVVNDDYSYHALSRKGIGKLNDGKYYSYAIKENEAKELYVEPSPGVACETTEEFRAIYDSSTAIDLSKVGYNKASGYWVLKDTNQVMDLSYHFAARQASDNDDRDLPLVEAYLEVAEDESLKIHWKTSVTATEYDFVTTVTAGGEVEGLKELLSETAPVTMSKTVSEVLSAITLNNTMHVSAPAFECDVIDVYSTEKYQVTVNTGWYNGNWWEGCVDIAEDDSEAYDAGVYYITGESNVETDVTEDLPVVESAFKIMKDKGGSPIEGPWYENVFYSPYLLASLAEQADVIEAFEVSGGIYETSDQGLAADFEVVLDQVDFHSQLETVLGQAVTGVLVSLDWSEDGEGHITSVYVDFFMCVDAALTKGYPGLSIEITDFGTTSFAPVDNFLAEIASAA